MATCITSFLPRIISPEQGVFQCRKLIQSNIGLASKLTNLMGKASRGGGLGLKLDVRKAFDTLRWDFLFMVLSKFGFSETMIGWIFSILHSARISILLHGGSIGFFEVSRGLRQGDPISPILFIIAEEVLYRGLKDLAKKNLIKPIASPREKYQSFSGQDFNLHKSNMFLGKASADKRQWLVESMVVPIYYFPTNYLGVEIFQGRVKRDPLLPVMDKIKARFSGWKGKVLSLAGRVELIRSDILANVATMFNVVWINKPSVDEVIKWWKIKGKGWSLKDPWVISLVVSVDAIWREKNLRRYENKSRSSSMVFAAISRDVASL
ncbi:uncharacterized protein LOC122089769 [Macadamia integrifolia]|uniref:uncharacterized protein LOC122089769 n=1 Tax=Macadamia integrifolia TaxID=60698 RepID=UPI001C4F9863|nr:uncharacterized protein LOC122089769 [Macadamia integrifolia]